MNRYCKPEVTVLGPAASLVEGSKDGVNDALDPTSQIAQNECCED